MFRRYVRGSTHSSSNTAYYEYYLTHTRFSLLWLR